MKPKKKMISSKVGNRMYRKHYKHDLRNLKIVRGGPRLV